MKEYPEVSVVVVTRNRREDLAVAIESLRQQTYSNIEVVVVDNGSSDGTTEMLKESFPEVGLVELGRNTGPYHGRNVGTAASNGDILFFLDDDATLERGALTKIVDRFSVEEALGVIVCRLIQGGSGVPKAYLFSHMAITPDAECYLGNMVAEGATAIRRDVFEQVGRWPAHYFLCGVGKDLSFRVIDAGYNIIYFPKATVYHKESSLDNSSREQIVKDRMFYLVRNQLWTSWKYFPVPRAALETVIKITYHFGEAWRKGALLPYFHGLWAAISTMPRVLMKERRPVSSRTIAKIDYMAYGGMITRAEMLESFRPIGLGKVLWRKLATLVPIGGPGNSTEESR